MLERLAFDCSNCHDGTFALGGPGGHAKGVYCTPHDPMGDFVSWSAEQADSGDRYSLKETVIDVKGAYLFEIERRGSVLPFDPSVLPPGGGSDLCGAPVNAPPG